MERVAGTELTHITAAVRESLEPPKLAIVGRVKAGKSTLVNALIGAKVAPTNDAECTRIVTWYRYGMPDSAELVLRDGTVRPVQFAGALPEDLGVPLDSVSHAVVYLQAAALQDYTLIDTPGLSTTTRENDEATRRAILGGEAARQADAIIYVFKKIEKADDISFMTAFREASGGSADAAEAIGVLSNADRFGAGAWGPRDPISVAAETADQIGTEHAAHVSAVIPIAGRMGEAARTGEVRESDAAVLAGLAHLDDDDARDLEDGILDIPDMDAAAISRVVTMFRGYGLRHGRTIARDGAAALTAWLLERSGMAALEGALRSRYVGSHPHRSIANAVAALADAARTSPHRSALGELLNAARLDPALHVIRELEARERLAARFPDDELLVMLDTLMQQKTDRARLGLGRSASDHDVLVRARECLGDARGRAALAGSPELAEANRVMVRSYQLIADRYHDAANR
ncbi:dynamin family protein [Salinibacterium sp. G-O1]|uniref:dynamin family protein n=1 Tax=Salinibacterium sp. G-O1 TaxID=3046208 RepID=UPI0024B99EEB|nr:dynamin family protein [Salinibacterium sp. G-O1]MDJ0334595.1 dynamin family protein [Salinibacterium sp. G-O1]